MNGKNKWVDRREDGLMDDYVYAKAVDLHTYEYIYIYTYVYVYIYIYVCVSLYSCRCSTTYLD